MTDRQSDRFCYVILAHTDPAGLLRLVRRIRALSPHAAIVVRHEDPALIGPAELTPLDAIDLVSDVRVHWGAWSMVGAMVEALRVALERTDAGHVVLISGQDYPIRPLTDWEDEVRASGAGALLAPMPPSVPGLGRHYLTFGLPGRRTVAKRAVHWAMDRIGRAAEPRFQLYRMDRSGPDRWWLSWPRRNPGVAPSWYVKASQWMTFRRDVLDEVLRIAGPDLRGLRRVRTYLVPDEVALQSLTSAICRSVRHEPTSALNFRAEESSPDWLTPALVRELAATSRAPFARKLPVTGWEEAVAAADAVVAERSRSGKATAVR